MKNVTVLVLNNTQDFEEMQFVVVGETRLTAERAMLNALKEMFKKSDEDTKLFYENDFEMYKRAWHIDYNEVPLHTEIPRWQTVFADFDYDYIALIEELGPGWVDDAWRNDTCPKAAFSFGEEGYNAGATYVDLFFDYNNIELSEHKEIRGKDIFKFGLCDEYGDFLFQTDDWNAMKEWIKTELPKWYDNKYLSGP